MPTNDKRPQAASDVAQYWREQATTLREEAGLAQRRSRIYELRAEADRLEKKLNDEIANPDRDQ